MKKHCCKKMAAATRFECDIHDDQFDCPDTLIHYSPVHQGYGVIVHDGGSSFVLIQYCPWCGTRHAVDDEMQDQLDRRIDP